MAPTQEERIAALEQITKEHQQIIQEHHSVLHTLAYDPAVVRGSVFDQDDMIQEIEEDEDMEASFKQLVEYQVRAENQIDMCFNQVEAFLDKIEANMATNDDIANMIANFKNEMAAMESRILNAVQQLVSVVSTQRPQSE